MDDIFSKEFNDKITNMVDSIIAENEDSFKPENIQDKIDLNILMLDYLRKLGRTPENYSDVIPVSFDLLAVSTKTKILKDCLDKGIMIEKSKIYNESIEGSFEPNYYQDASKFL